MLCGPNGINATREGSVRVQVRPAGVVSFPFVCRRNPEAGPLGVVRRTGVPRVALATESRVDNERTYMKFGRFMRGSVSPKFRNRFFKIEEINNLAMPGFFGISRQETRGNQADFLADMCVRIPISRVEESPGGRVLRLRGATDCVAFRTLFPKILIELEWDNSDDLDMVLTTPDGSLVNQFNPTNAGARYNGASHPICGPAFGARELITWSRNMPPLGKYSLQLRHFKKCMDNNPANYVIRISSGDKLQFSSTGVSSEEGRMQIVMFELGMTPDGTLTVTVL